MTVTVRTNLDDVAGIAVAEARVSNSNFTDLTKTCLWKDVQPGDDNAKFPVYSTALAASGLTDGNSVNYDALNASATSLTPGPNAYSAIQITDNAKLRDKMYMEHFGKVGASRIQTKKNADVFALYTGFTTNTVACSGNTNGAITVESFDAAKAKLVAAGAEGVYVFVGTPGVIADLKDSIGAATGGAYWLTEAQKTAYSNGQPLVYNGVQILECNRGVSETGTITCGMYAAEGAIGYANGVDYDLKQAEDPDIIGTKLVLYSLYAVGVINEEWGCAITCKT